MANCINCKADLPEGMLFCPFCGKSRYPTKEKSGQGENGIVPPFPKMVQMELAQFNAYDLTIV